jgi:putative flippase GtrA
MDVTSRSVEPMPVLDVVIPVYNEEAGLDRSVRIVHAFLRDSFPYPARLTIADNASTDGTLAIARTLAGDLDGVRVLHLEEKGRGRTLHRAWLESDAEVLAYMDVDLSTDLAALLPLVAPLVSGHSHIAIGSRLTRSSHVTRGPKREVVSRAYNLLLRGTLRTHFSDAQCGFKAIRADVARELLPLVADTEWFFDTELLVLAERAGLRIHEVPVDWVDDPDSRVDLVATARADLKGIARLGRDLATGRLPLAEAHAQIMRESEPKARPRSLLAQLSRFVVVGVLSTLAYAALYLLLRQGVDAQVANVLALLTTAVLNTAANRRLTFGIRGRDDALRHQGQGLVVFALAWGLTAGSLALLHAVAPVAPHGVELAVLVAANLTATVLRFVLLRRWVFRAAEREGPATGPEAAQVPIAHASPSYEGADA